MSTLYQCKMSFNPGPSKQVQKVVFRFKVLKPVHTTLICFKPCLKNT